MPGAIATHRAGCRARSWPSWMMVPQLASGGCTPMERNDSANSVSMLIASISGTKTISVVITLGRMSRNRMRWLGTPRPDGREHELAFLQRQHLAADRPRHIGNVDDADDEDGQPQAARGDGDRPDVEAMGDQHDRERDRQQDRSERPRSRRAGARCTVSMMPPKKPATSPISAASTRQMMVEAPAISSELRPP